MQLPCKRLNLQFTAEWAPPAQTFQQVQKERSEEERLGEVEAQKLLLEEEAELQRVSSGE